MIRKILAATAISMLLCQCNVLKSDCAALSEREAQIAQEPAGDYYVGRRYYIEACRFWGYIRPAGKSWREAKLVIMDEHVTHTPDRGVEPPVKGAVYGTDHNHEYYVRGKYTGEVAYDPSTDQVLPVFQATSYQLRNAKPGFLFVPSERYDTKTVSLRPAIMPTPQQCAAASR